MTNDRALVMARDEILTLLGEAMDIGFAEPGELRLKLAGIQDVCSELRAWAEKVAEEQAERMDPEPYDSGWVADFNRSQRER